MKQKVQTVFIKYEKLFVKREEKTEKQDFIKRMTPKIRKHKAVFVKHMNQKQKTQNDFCKIYETRNRKQNWFCKNA